MELFVNGKLVAIEPHPGEMLSHLLRYRLGLTGTKIGCNEAECGTCTVLVEDEAVLSCLYPAERASKKRVLTIEGLASVLPEGILYSGDENDLIGLHPLQAAFALQGAVQCGFCTPGQIMAAWGLLLRSPNPSEQEIRLALKNMLCRCGSYPRIIQAIQMAASAMSSKQPLFLPQAQFPASSYKAVGKLYIRPDARSKVTGSTRFTDDLVFDEMLYARVKRAGVPHAFLTGLDTAKARSLPGVVCVLTADNLPGARNHGVVIPDWPVMVGIGERIRTVGDALAIVAAESEDIAEEAVQLITASFDLQPVLENPYQALETAAPKLHLSGNLLKHIKVRKNDVNDGFAASDLVMEHTFQTASTEHAFLEPECSLARLISEGGMEVYVGSQIPYADRAQIANALGLTEDKVRVIGMAVGGGFGGKEDIAGQIHAALLAQVTGKPVKLLFDRQESLWVHPKRHATQIRVKLGSHNDGCLLAVETELYGDTGAYASLGEKVMTRATTHSCGPYDIPHTKADCFAVYTNNPPAGAFRGFGVTQACFAIESMMDMLAETLEKDPFEIRALNALEIGKVTSTGQVLNESVGLKECIELVSAEVHRLGGEQPFVGKFVHGSPHLRRAWGCAVAYKNTGLGDGASDMAKAIVELLPDGKLEVRSSSAEIGQGLLTVLQILVAEEFETSPGGVQVLLSDTDHTPDGGPTTASRQTYVCGNAARGAAQALKQAIISTLSEKLDQSPDKIRFAAMGVMVNGLAVSLKEVYALMKSEARQTYALYEYLAPTTHPLEEGGNMHFAYSFAAQGVEVEVNTKTGEVRVLRVVAANDIGKAINPLGLQSQVEGGIIMGLGIALSEKFIVEKGIVHTNRLARYRIPTIQQTPEIISFIVEHPTAAGPYGAKGVGELASIPTAPAVTNAIYHAVGVRVDHLPVDQEELLWKIKAAST